MIAILQRVNRAAVAVDEMETTAIDRGLCVFVGVERVDDGRQARRMAERLCGYRVFPDDEGRMNRSVIETSGDILLILNFTVAAGTTRGTRADFSTAAFAEQALPMFAQLIMTCEEFLGKTVPFGRFAADMQVELVNSGPVTFTLRCK